MNLEYHNYRITTDSYNYIVLNNTLSLYWGTQSIDWTPDPEDKVNVSDMRKLAGDVAGTEEVMVVNLTNR